jgi:hypothetical protein
MVDIEEEFRLLMEEAIKKIDDKENNGELSSYEAQRLRDMVEKQQQEEKWCCPEGHTDPDCGWSQSMGYHCW